MIPEHVLHDAKQLKGRRIWHRTYAYISWMTVPSALSSKISAKFPREKNRKLCCSSITLHTERNPEASCEERNTRIHSDSAQVTYRCDDKPGASVTSSRRRHHRYQVTIILSSFVVQYSIIESINLLSERNVL